MRKAAFVAVLGCGGCLGSLISGAGGAPTAGTTGGSSSGVASSGTTAGGGSTTGAGTSSGTGTAGGSSGTSTGGTTGGSTTGAPDAGAALPPWIGVIGTGANLGIGVYGSPVLSTARKYHNLKLEDDGPDPRYAFDGGGRYSLVPLVEPLRPLPLPGWSDYQYPNDIFGETPHTALGNQLTALSLAADAGELVSVQTDVGDPWSCIGDVDREGSGRAYQASLAEARVISALAADAGRAMRYDAVVLTGGECDSYDLGYEPKLLQLWVDYDGDLRGITGQDGGVTLVETQQSAIDPYPDGTGSMLELWQAGVDYPGKIVCAGPKYQYAYAPDSYHLLPSGYVRLGEKYAEVVAAIEAGRGWAPLEPTGATHAGNLVTISFRVAFPPLNWDENQPAGHQTANTAWAMGRGFEVTDLASGLQIPIESAEISGDDVVLTLGFDPDAGALPDGGIELGYAMTTDAPGVLVAGQPAGRHGALRDSDPLVGIDAETLDVQVVQGSATVTGLFNYRAVWDRVAPGELPKETVVLAVDPASSTLTLSNPWPGPTGTDALTFWHEQRNYCVDFQMRLP